MTEGVSLAGTTGLSPSLCPSNCSGHGICQHGICICQVQWTGGECAQANYSYVVTFGSIFTLLTLVSFAQLILSSYHDAQRTKKDLFRAVFTFTAHKWLYFVAWLAAGSRAFCFIMQEGLSSAFAMNVQSIYYPFLITLVSLLACLLGERYYLDVPLSETHHITKSLYFYVGYNVVLWATFFIKIVLTFAVPEVDQTLVHYIFYLVFAVMMLITVTAFLFYGVLMFYKVSGAFKTDDCRVNSMQLGLSRAGVFFQGIFQLVLVTLLIIDFSSYFFPRGTGFNRDLFDIISRLTDLAVVVWFPCALWNCKRPETLWILNPRQVLDTTSGEYAPLYAENPSFYGSTFRRRSTGRASSESTEDFECWICYDVTSAASGALICPCDCKGGTAAVHHNCLKRWLQEQGELSVRKVPHCDVCQKPYTLDRSRGIELSCTPMQGVRTSILVLCIVTMPLVAVFTMKHFMLHALAKYTIIVVVVVLELVCLRLLGVTFDAIFHRALIAAVTIVGVRPALLAVSSSSPSPSPSSCSQATASVQQNSAQVTQTCEQRTPSPTVHISSAAAAADIAGGMRGLTDVETSGRSVLFSVQPIL